MNLHNGLDGIDLFLVGGFAEYLHNPTNPLTWDVDICVIVDESIDYKRIKTILDDSLRIGLDIGILLDQKAVTPYLAAMASWCDANPTKRKTIKGIKRFVNSWLARAQDRGGSPQAKQQGKSDSIRAKTIDMQLTDISWLDGDNYLMMKQHYLNTRGFYFDGELKNA